MIHDKLIDILFFKNNAYNKSTAVKYNLKKKNKYINIHNYILHRYNDSESERETIYRIHNNIENKMINHKELQIYISNGYTLGRKKKL